MKTLAKNAIKWAAIALFGVTGLSVGMVGDAWGAEVAGCRIRPMIKNLTALSAPPCVVRAAVPHELTGKEVKRLAATAESAGDHLTLAGYYAAQADRLDARGAGYEQAAVAFRSGPIVKNLASPTTAARYDYFAKEFREKANSDRELAAEHERMAKGARSAL